MGKGMGILVNNGYAFKITTPSSTFSGGVLDLNAFGGESAYQVWLDEGNTGTTTDFLADVGGLVIGDVMSTYAIDVMSATKSFVYTDGALTQMTLNVNAEDKYVVDFNYVDGVLTYKLITRSDTKWVKYTYSYTNDELTGTVVTEG